MKLNFKLFTLFGTTFSMIIFGGCMDANVDVGPPQVNVAPPQVNVALPPLPALPTPPTAVELSVATHTATLTSK